MILYDTSFIRYEQVISQMAACEASGDYARVELSDTKVIFDSATGKNEVYARFSVERSYSHIPELESHCNSWVVTRKGNGEVIGEFFNLTVVKQFNPKTCLIETAAQYLGRLNRDLLAQS